MFTYHFLVTYHLTLVNLISACYSFGIFTTDFVFAALAISYLWILNTNIIIAFFMFDHTTLLNTFMLPTLKSKPANIITLEQSHFRTFNIPPLRLANTLLLYQFDTYVTTAGVTGFFTGVL